MRKYSILWTGPVSGTVRQYPERFNTHTKANRVASRLVKEGHARSAKVKLGKETISNF